MYTLAHCTMLADLPSEILGQAAGNELTQIATLRAALPKRLHAGFNAQIRDVIRCFGPANGMIYKAALNEFPNLVRVCWFNDPNMPPLPPTVEHLEYHPECTVTLNGTAIFDPQIAPRNLITLKLYCMLHDPDALAAYCPNLLDLQFTAHSDTINAQSLMIQKLRIVGRVVSARLPGTITDLRIPGIDMDSINWSFTPALVRVKCGLFRSWRAHMSSLRFCDAGGIEFCADTKYSSITDAEGILPFVPEMVKLTDGDIFPSDKNMRIRYLSETTVPSDDRVEILELVRLSQPTTFPPRLKDLTMVFSFASLDHLPPTLTRLHVGLFHVKIDGAGLCNLLDLAITNRSPTPLSELLKAFPDSKKLTTLEVYNCCDMEKCNKLWSNFPNLSVIYLTGYSDVHPDIRILGRYRIAYDPSKSASKNDRSLLGAIALGLRG